MKLSYLDIHTTDPAFNLAFEQYVFDCLPRDRAYFILWQNENAIIVGKHQNTAAEINEHFVKDLGIKVVRRLSGGAVYHDLGNLNFTFTVDAGDALDLNFSQFCVPVVDALEEMGVRAEINGRNDITTDGKIFRKLPIYSRRARDASRNHYVRFRSACYGAGSQCGPGKSLGKMDPIRPQPRYKRQTPFAKRCRHWAVPRGTVKAHHQHPDRGGATLFIDGEGCGGN